MLYDVDFNIIFKKSCNVSEGELLILSYTEINKKKKLC